MDHGPVGESGPVDRVDPVELEQVGHVHPRRPEGGLQQVRHAQHGGPGVESVAVQVEAAGPAPGAELPLHHDHLVAGAGQVAGGAEAAQPGPHHHYPLHVDRHVMWVAASSAERLIGPGASCRPPQRPGCQLREHGPDVGRYRRVGQGVEGIVVPGTDYTFDLVAGAALDQDVPHVGYFGIT